MTSVKPGSLTRDGLVSTYEMQMNFDLSTLASYYL